MTAYHFFFIIHTVRRYRVIKIIRLLPCQQSGKKKQNRCLGEIPKLLILIDNKIKHLMNFSIDEFVNMKLENCTSFFWSSDLIKTCNRVWPPSHWLMYRPFKKWEIFCCIEHYYLSKAVLLNPVSATAHYDAHDGLYVEKHRRI